MTNNKFQILLILVLFNFALAAIFLFFIPAFKGNIQPNPIISLGIFNLKWYGLILALSILSAYLIARKNSWRVGIGREEVDSLTFWLVLAGLLGARAYYVLFDWPYFSAHPSEIYKIWHGGLSIYGALIGGLIFVLVYSRKKAYDKFQLLDLVALSLPLAQAIGRFGNFLNQEAYGYPTALPWGMYIAATKQFHHPTFLYEVFWNAVVFLILLKLIGRFKNGSLAFAYLGLYSLGRFFIEPLRVDSVFIAGFRVDQVVAFVAVVFSVGMFFRLNSPAIANKKY